MGMARASQQFFDFVIHVTNELAPLQARPATLPWPICRELRQSGFTWEPFYHPSMKDGERASIASCVPWLRAIDASLHAGQKDPHLLARLLRGLAHSYSKNLNVHDTG
jgi:hypothetical protein